MELIWSIIPIVIIAVLMCFYTSVFALAEKQYGKTIISFFGSKKKFFIVYVILVVCLTTFSALNSLYFKM